MRRAIGSVMLRNEYTVYECLDCYEVESANRHGQRFTQEVQFQVVEFMRVRLAGLNVTSDEAAAALELAAKELSLPYAYGHKLKFYAQAVLIVLVALARASHKKVGHG
jgi:hypothetical protein